MCDYPSSLAYACTGYTPCGGCGCAPCRCGKSKYEYTKSLLTPPQMPASCYGTTKNCLCDLSTSAPCRSCGLSPCQCALLRKYKQKWHEYKCDYRYENCMERCQNRRDRCHSVCENAEPLRGPSVGVVHVDSNSKSKSDDKMLHYVIVCDKDDKKCLLRESTMRSDTS
jgi:hypothetical protein